MKWCECSFSIVQGGSTPLGRVRLAIAKLAENLGNVPSFLLYVVNPNREQVIIYLPIPRAFFGLPSSLYLHEAIQKKNS